MRWVLNPLFDTLALDVAMSSWLGTPYKYGMRVRGQGVDCINLVAGVLDRLYKRTSPTPVPCLPQGICDHEASHGVSLVVALRKAFNSRKVENNIIEPGDILVVRSVLGSSLNIPGHALIAGNRPGTLLHATPGSPVSWTSLEAAGHVVRIYRPLNKNLWSL